MTIYFLKDLISGVKKRVYGHQVRHITIPAYEGLAIRNIAAFTNLHGRVHDYLPDGKEVLKMPKQWIGNIVHSVLKNIFSDWVKMQIERRNEEMLVERGLTIDMDPEVAAAFQASTKTSGKCLHISSYHLSFPL